MSMTPADLARRSQLRQAVILNSISAGSVPDFVLFHPTLSAIAPNTMVDGSGNVTLTLTGTNFRAGAECVINGQPGTLPATVVNATTLTTVVDTNALAAGNYTMYVKEGPVDSGALPFTITAGVARTVTVTVVDDLGGAFLIVAQVASNQPGPFLDGEIEWGDGTANNRIATIPASAQHTYAADGTYSVRVLDRNGPVSNVVAVTVPHAADDAEEDPSRRPDRTPPEAPAPEAPATTKGTTGKRKAAS